MSEQHRSTCFQKARRGVVLVVTRAETFSRLCRSNKGLNSARLCIIWLRRQGCRLRSKVIVIQKRSERPTLPESDCVSLTRTHYSGFTRCCCVQKKLLKRELMYKVEGFHLILCYHLLLVMHQINGKAYPIIY